MNIAPAYVPRFVPEAAIAAACTARGLPADRLLVSVVR